MKKLLTTIALAITFYGVTMAKQTPKHLYKIVSLENWKKSKNKEYLVLTEMDKEFVHFSTNTNQVEYVVSKFWKDKPYMLLTIDTEKTPGIYKLEYNKSKTDQFWHLYNGAIPHSAIEKAEIITP